MKKFNFSLQRVLEIKEQLLKNLKNELKDIMNQMYQVEAEIFSLKEKYSCVNKEFVLKTSVSLAVGEVVYYKTYMESVLKKIEICEEDKKILNKKIEAKQQEIINMNIETSSLEKLKEKEMMIYNKEVAKSEEIFIEEFVSNSRMSKPCAS